MTARIDDSTPPDSAADTLGARERILSAAFELFHESGYAGTSVTRIARAAGMTPAAIYWHFPSKQDVLAAMLKRMYETSYSDLRGSVRTEGSATERLGDYVRAYVRIQLEDLGDRRNHSYSALASSLTTEDQRALGLLSRPYIELLREILQQGVQSGTFDIDDMSVTSYAISTMCENVFTWFRVGGRLSIDEVAEHHFRLVLRMVNATPARPA
ncbi:TetR/AcrR family transcriptional regulator [Nocardioides sp. QY071]|uniref:TetR/AcrR family transcriptional regulator n=1 Tax=Nocardioides sp. QY071 TaxID=3044187 RepID=UPI002499DD76|nr:TetR/AcrR family transcriptional regulator [Nocardioides sp. QY071]WGY02872.1 TetR/AcrR family transcriptional regulator [Nocardioides sp. QY071]